MIERIIIEIDYQAFDENDDDDYVEMWYYRNEILSRSKSDLQSSQSW